LRISLGGGGTDLPSYYLEHGGFVISAAIDKYVYITLHQTFVEDLIIKYSHMERVSRVEDVAHPIIREALKLVGVGPQYLEIASMSDIPAGTGLGSSGSFTTALLQGLHILRKNFITKRELAEEACHIEINLLGEPIGKQDQYIAAFGGVTCFHFGQDGSVEVAPLKIDPDTLHALEDNLMLVFTGYTRSAGAILKDQDSRSKSNEQCITDNLHRVKEMGLETKEAFERGDLNRVGEIMHTHWENKKKRAGAMSNSQIDCYYELARNNGAIGGKLVGAGGGGFLLFYAENKAHLRRALCREAGLRELRIRFDFEGTGLVTKS
jgi:D-glycero-alpha-D-manno-heptose-7-phosphate kinase